MNFGSDYVYLYEDPEYEYISDDEYEQGMNLSSRYVLVFKTIRVNIVCHTLQKDCYIFG